MEFATHPDFAEAHTDALLRHATQPDDLSWHAHKPARRGASRGGGTTGVHVKEPNSGNDKNW